MPPHGPKGSIVQRYRGFTLVTVPMGHTNVQEGDGFYGGYSSLPLARRRVDEIVTRRNTVCERVELPDGRVGYRVYTPTT